MFKKWRTKKKKEPKAPIGHVCDVLRSKVITSHDFSSSSPSAESSISWFTPFINGSFQFPCYLTLSILSFLSLRYDLPITFIDKHSGYTWTKSQFNAHHIPSHLQVGADESNSALEHISRVITDPIQQQCELNSALITVIDSFSMHNWNC